MWRHGIYSFLELLRHRLPASLEYMVTFIYLAYILYDGIAITIGCEIFELGKVGLLVSDRGITPRLGLVAPRDVPGVGGCVSVCPSAWRCSASRASSIKGAVSPLPLKGDDCDNLLPTSISTTSTTTNFCRRPRPAFASRCPTPRSSRNGGCHSGEQPFRSRPASCNSSRLRKSYLQGQLPNVSAYRA